jgi:2-polyprenyl-3-methyl-5-hydroxy-6-metoxy-1,4-benzoquinol methylase
MNTLLETVLRCPMCDCASHHTRFNALPDFVFRATDEHWRIEKCDECYSLFLASRPRVDAIGRYYQRYYTHENESDSAAISGISVQSGFAKKLANSWRNQKYGSTRPSLGLIGVAAVLASPPLRHWIDAECRHLPGKSSTKRPLRVLDVGHGDGRFLKFVKEIGHEAMGLEIDPKAVEQARAAQLDVHQGDIDAATSIWGEGFFDYITMSHVIEHVHHPRAVIGTASRLLSPGGQLWIECPNPEARGINQYGGRWRDLDPPRHLCIPSRKALLSVAAEHDLALGEEHYRPFVPFEVYPFSSLAQGHSKAAGYRRAARAELLNVFTRRKREWLTLTFTKPINR